MYIATQLDKWHICVNGFPTTSFVFTILNGLVRSRQWLIATCTVSNQFIVTVNKYLKNSPAHKNISLLFN